MNSAVYPEEVEHLSRVYGCPRRFEIKIDADPEFLRSFRDSLRRRRAEVAFVIRRHGGLVLASAKTFYPAGVYRLPTGGVKPGEAVEEALWRELQEETGLHATSAHFAALLDYRLESRGITVRFASYLFVVNAPVGCPRCSDPDEEICDYREVTASDLRVLAEELGHLGPGWQSWGVWRAVPHSIAADILEESGAEEIGP